MSPLLAITGAEVMFAAGCLLLTLILMKRSYRYFGGSRRKRDNAPIARQPRPSTVWDGSQRDSFAQIEKQKVEMHEMARDLNGQLTSRILVLEQLIGESQQKIDRLEQLLEEQKLPSGLQSGGSRAN